jgi:hypothetical protein
MNGGNPVTWLMFFTLASGLVVAAGAFLFFLRSQRNRDAAAATLQGDGVRSGPTPRGAGAELGGLLAVALVAMGLLSAGYAYRDPARVAQTQTPPAESTTTGMATGNAAVSNPNAPKPYQPVNPAPDLRTSPTGSTAGQGADSGGRPEQMPARQ